MADNIGDAIGRIIIDTTSVDSAVRRMEDASSRISRLMRDIDASLSSSSNNSMAAAARLIKAQAESMRAHAAEMTAQAKLTTSRMKEESEKRIADAKAEAAAIKSARDSIAKPRAAGGEMRNTISDIKAAISAAESALKARQKDINAAAGSSTDKSGVNSVIQQYVKDIQEAKEELSELKRQTEAFLRDPASRPNPQKKLNRLNDIVSSFEGGVNRDIGAAQEIYKEEQALRDIARTNAETAAAAVRAYQQKVEAAKRAADAQVQAQKNIDAQMAESNRKMIEGQRRAEQEANKQLNLGMRTGSTGAQTAINAARAQIAALENEFKRLQSNAPIGMNIDDLAADIARAKQPILDLQADLSNLRVAMQDASLTPKQKMAIIEQLEIVRQAAINAGGQGLDPIRQKIAVFDSQMQRLTTGIRGYFNRLREELNELNRQSLGKNIQELGFRLSPMALASGQGIRTGVDISMSLEEANLAFRAMTNSESEALDLMNQLTESAQKFGLPITDTFRTMQRFIPLIKQSGGEIDKVIEIAARLMTLNPVQGFEGAMFSITEAMASGSKGLDAISLRERFGIVPDQLRQAREETGNLVDALDLVLNRMSRTSDLALAFGQTTRASFTRARDALGLFLSQAVEPLLNFITPIIEKFTEFLTMLRQVNSPIADIIGVVMGLTAGIVALTFAIGNLLIAGQAVTAVFRAKAATTAADTAATAANTTATAANTAAQVGAGAGAGGRASGAMGGLARVAGVGVAVGGGIALGTAIAGGMGIPGIENQQDALERIIQLISMAGAGLATAVEIIKTVIENGANIIAAVIRNIITTFSAIGPFLGDIFGRIGAFLSDVISGLERTIGSLLRGLADSLSGIMDTTEMRNAGNQLTERGEERHQTARELLDAPVKAFNEYIVGQLTDISQMDFLPSREQMAQIASNTNYRMVELFNTIAGIANGLGASLSLIDIPGPAEAQSVTGSYTPLQAAPTLDEDQLQKAYELLVNDMIEATRRLEDEAIDAAREVEDFMRSRKQAIDDFNLSQARDLEDYERDRAKRIADYNEQIAEEDDRLREERVKKERDFATEQLRHLEDHLLKMSRMQRDVDDAISARDFLAAQKAVQRMKDEQEDFDIANRRRIEDYEKQLLELEENLQEQRKKRKDDFDKQLREMDDNFARKRQREVADFTLRMQREDQERAIRQAREQADRDLANLRRTQDFQIQLGNLMNHNTLMQEIWQNGLDVLTEKTREFFDAFTNTISPIGNGHGSGSGGWGTGQGGGWNGTIGGGGASSISVGIPPMNPTLGTEWTDNTGKAWIWGPHGWLPKNSAGGVGGGAIISPLSAGIRRGEFSMPVSGGGAIGGNTIVISPQISVDASGQNLDEDKLTRLLEDRIVDRMSEYVEKEVSRNGI